MTPTTNAVFAAAKQFVDNLKAAPDHATAPVDGWPTVVVVLDEIGPGGAHHSYVVAPCDNDGMPKRDEPVFAKIEFQKGGRAASGVNGCTELDLLGILTHRLAAFQKGEFPSEDNERALNALDSAMYWLNKRTKDRMDRGVEGKEVA